MIIDDVLAKIREKRDRQKTVHGWTPAHDDHHTCGEIAIAAIPYIQAAHQTDLGLLEEELLVFWPWMENQPNLKQPVEELLINAAALLVAELERLGRIRKAEALATT